MCTVEQFADCGDILTIGRALFVPEKEDNIWLTTCSVSLSSCGNLLAVGYKKRLCLLTAQWISSNERNTYLISWNGTLPSEITACLALSICPSHHSSQNGPDWFCIVVGFQNGSIGFYTNTGHLLFLEKLDDKSVLKISCHTGTYGTLPDDIHILFPSGVCVLSGSSLFQTLRNAKAQLAKVQAGIQDNYAVDSRSIPVRKWTFSEQEQINDAMVVGLELKNTFDHFLSASTYGGYDTWYRSIPPVHSLVLTSGVSPYIGFHYALEGGTTPPLQDVARAVANKIKSSLPGWLGGSTDSAPSNTEPLIRAESLSMRNGIYDSQRSGSTVAISPDRRLAAFSDNLGRVAVLDISKGYIIRLFKGYRDAQCAFVQIYDADNRKPQLSVVKEIRRATFLIIYNPKKGLIDIRLMQRGSRVAVFTATKNGKLLYNTCGLVGAEKCYNHKKLNLPELQCVLIDPDGKLKKFNIPFYYSLEGEHLERSKDLHIIRSIREVLKKTSHFTDEVTAEITESADKLKTLQMKKLCIEMIIKNCGASSGVLISCLELFWDGLPDHKPSEQVTKLENYLGNLTLVTLFFRHVNNENTDDMKNLADKIYAAFEINNQSEKQADDDSIQNEDLEFELLEDDNCILERLLILAQESDSREAQNRVSFADNRTSTYKDFISCFVLEERNQYIGLKPDLQSEKVNNLSADIFKSIVKINDLSQLSKFVANSKIDPKEMVRLVVMHLMNMPLGEINIHLIENIIAVIYYICSVSEEARDITYNELSPWWESVRTMLVDLSCPLRSMILAMACKAVSKMFEESSERDEAWESVTKENAKWGILIGKLEDISILSIILMFKDNFRGKTMPKLQLDEVNVNLKYIYTRGKGSVAELISRWLCSMGIPPEAVVANELLETHDAASNLREPATENEQELLFMENNRSLVDENPQIFKWLSLLRRQFPLSTSADYLIANMCWEYATEWQKHMTNMDVLRAAVHSLDNITDLYVRLGLLSIIWSTYIRRTFESCCNLINKVGKLPKDHLCVQDLGFNGEWLVTFLETTTKYLDKFNSCAAMPLSSEKTKIQFEKIWDESLPSLVEVAQSTRVVNNDILKLNYQISCTVYFQCHFNIKYSKPLDNLYDVDYRYVLEALGGTAAPRTIGVACSDKIMTPRMKYLTKLIRTANDTISFAINRDKCRTYNSEECLRWIDSIGVLAELWGVDENFVKRQHVIGLYHMGYDEMAENMLGSITDPEALLSPVLAITVQRLKRHLEDCSNQPEWIVSMPPQLYKRMQNTPADPSIPANPSLSTTVLVLQRLHSQVVKRTSSAESLQHIKLSELIIESCELLIRRRI